VLRYDLGTRSFLTPYAIGTAPVRGADITPDGQYLYVAVGPRISPSPRSTWTQARSPRFRIRRRSWNPVHGTWDRLDGYGFLTTRFAGSGTVPLRRIRLSDDSLVELGTTDQDRNIWRSFDHSQLVFASFVFATTVYDAATSSFRAPQAVSIFDDAVAISRDRALIASAGYSTLVVYNNALTELVFSTGDYDLNGGLAFDPVRDLLYVGNTETSEVVAFDTRTWQEKFRFSGFLHGIQTFHAHNEG